MKRYLPFFRSTLIIFLSFLLTSVGHLSWMYHLMEQTTAQLSYQLSTVAGYALQALGVGAFAVLLRQKRIAPRVIFVASMIAYAACLVPSVMGTSLIGTAAFGLLLSLFCGVIAGYYLYELTGSAPDSRRALSFGVGYGTATIASWLLSLIDGGTLYYGSKAVILCLVLTPVTILSAFLRPSLKEEQREPPPQPKMRKRSLLILSAGVVLLFSLVNNLGFSFSAAEVQGGLRPEFSRVFYAIGLIAAGFVTDKSRKFGAVCALAALVIPFIELALRGEQISYTVFWALGYLAFGFYSVYRIILFSDYAKGRGTLFLSGMGLMIGRIGDALGSEISTLLEGYEAALVILSALLFIGSVFVFIKLFQTAYVPVLRQKSEREIFSEFAALHDLSAREREVLQLLLQNKTNKEISESICVSESTVKFHIHNLLSKTGSKNRTDLMDIYNRKR